MIELLSVNHAPVAAGLAGLADLHHNKLQAILIDELRQEAGPSVIEELKRALLEAAFRLKRADVSDGSRRLPPQERDMLNAGYRVVWDLSREQPRLLRLSQMAMPGKPPLKPRGQDIRMNQFLHRYMDVVKYDLEKLGYSITPASGSRYTIHAIALSRDAPEDPITAVTTYSSYGAALRVSQCN